MSAEKTYQMQADAALAAFQRNEISFAQWNRLQSDAAVAYWTAKQQEAAK